MAALGFDVISVDWRMPIQEVRARIPGVAVQGNYDSTILFGPADVAVRRALQVAKAGATAPGYIFNLGHGIQPGTPPETVKAVVDAVHAFSWK